MNRATWEGKTKSREGRRETISEEYFIYYLCVLGFLGLYYPVSWTNIPAFVISFGPFVPQIIYDILYT